MIGKRSLLVLVGVLGMSSRSSAEVEGGALTIAGVAYRHVTCAAGDLELHWKNGKGEVMRTFPALTRELRADGREPVFLMNGGIFEPGGIPSGLLVLDGKTWCPINMKPGKGNFFLKPNGVFFVTAQGAGILESGKYAARKPVDRLAVQSGPLLLAQGRVHPAFRKGSPNLLHRNGVGSTRRDASTS